MDNLLQTLRFLERDHLDVVKESQLVLVCQDSCDPIPTQFAQYDHFNRELPCMQLPVVTNFGVQHSVAEKIIILESDRILPAGYFSRVLDDLHEGVMITTKNMLKLTRPATDEEIINGTFDSKPEDRSDTNEIGRRNMWSGNTAIMKSDFYKAGGMDEEYKGYGWADNDMTYALEAVGVKSVYLKGGKQDLELHLWHPEATYGEGDQKQLFINNGLRFCKKWKKPFPQWFREEIAKHRKVMA